LEKEELTLTQWLGELNKSQLWLAEILGCQPSYISMLANRHRQPSTKKASTDICFSIEEMSGGRVRAKRLIYGERSPLQVCRARKQRKLSAA
jgi:hypothetical protein